MNDDLKMLSRKLDVVLTRLESLELSVKKLQRGQTVLSSQMDNVLAEADADPDDEGAMDDDLMEDDDYGR